MDKYLKTQIAALRKKAKEEKWKGPNIKDTPSSLDRFIKTKEQADRLMKQLKELSKD
jgi:hypothetical protein